MTEPKLIATITDFRTKYANLATAHVWQSHYMNGGVAALVISESPGSPIECTPTVNLAAFGEFPAEGNVFIKDWEENKGVREALETAGVIGPAIREVPSGFVTVTEHKLLVAGE